MTPTRQRLGKLFGTFSLTVKSELSHANARIAIAAGFTLFCLAWVSSMPHIAGPGIPVGLTLLAAGLLFRLSARIEPSHIPPRLWLGLIIDQLAISTYVYLVGVSSSIIYPLYLWVAISNGYRFGQRYLNGALALGIFGLGVAVYLSPAWGDFWIVAFGQILGLLAVGLFSGRLMQHLENAQRQLEEWALDAEHRATHDGLTGLANRSLLDAFLTNQLARMNRYPSGHQLGLMYVDLDLFKDVNDIHGHEAGDLLLVEVARRLEGCIREVDLAARLGGDEFILVTPEIEGPDSLERLAERVLEELERPFQLPGIDTPVKVSASIGLVAAPLQGRDRDGLMHKADAAMYQAKRQGRHRYSWSSDS